MSQVRLIRQEMADNRKATEKAFAEFAEKFSQMASESLVNELRKVVDKFNVMLNDLVGQAFQDLKVSTDKLNQWQAEHREMLDQQHQNLASLLNQLSSLNTVYNESVQRLDVYKRQALTSGDRHEDRTAHRGCPCPCLLYTSRCV